MRLRPSVPAACAAVALLAAVAGPATAATAPVKAAGGATSAVSLLSVTAAGHDLAAGGVKLVTDTAGAAPVARIVVTPLVADGTAYGEVEVPSGTSRTVTGISSSAVAPALKGIAELTGPALTLTSSTSASDAKATAAAPSLGSLSVLGLPVTVQGALQTASSVTGAGAASSKTLSVEDVALPSIADLLAALGLDLPKLPLETLDALVDRLELVNGAVTAADKALADAQAAVKAQTDAATAEVAKQVAAVDAAQKELTARTGALAPLESALLEKNAALAAANKAATDAAAAQAAAVQRLRETPGAAAAVATLPASGLPVSALPVTGLVDTAVREAVALVDATTATAVAAAAQATSAKSAADLAQAAVDAAKAAVALAQTALDAANRLLTAARAALTGLTGQLAPLVRQLVAALVAALDGTPLVSLDSLQLETRSAASGAQAGQQSATVTGGEVQGLHVLGADVLEDVLGSSTVDVLDLTGGTLTKVTAEIDRLTGVLSQVLSAVPGVPTLKVPAPQVDLLTKTARTAVEGAFGTATTSVTGLAVTLPAITLPVELALPDALSLPGLSLLPSGSTGGVSAAAVGDLLTSTPTTLGFGTFTDTARFRAAAAAPVTSTPVTAVPGTAAPVAASGHDPGHAAAHGRGGRAGAARAEPARRRGRPAPPRSGLTAAARGVQA